MSALSSSDKNSFRLGVLIFSLLLTAWLWALKFVTTEANQGDVYRIIYVHVPSASMAFISALILFIASIAQLRQNATPRSLHTAKASAEVGLLFTFITLTTGSIWGKPTWGTWWTWDARLTTTFVLGLLFASYLLLCNSLDDPRLRNKACAVLGILIFIDVPIIYKSVTWWRTLHQPPSIMRSGGSTMDPEILRHLALCTLLLLCLGFWFIWQRVKNLQLKDLIDEAYHKQMLSSQS